MRRIPAEAKSTSIRHLSWPRSVANWTGRAREVNIEFSHHPLRGTAMASTASLPWVIADMSGSVLWLTLNRPGQRSPLSSQMINALQESLNAAEADAGVRCIVITGSGPAFSAGHDLREMTQQAGESDADCRARSQHRGVLYHAAGRGGPQRPP